MVYWGSMDLLQLLVTIGLIGGFIYVARAWSQGGDGGGCGTS